MWILPFVYILIAHYALSYIFLKNPLILKKKKKTKLSLIRKAVENKKLLRVVHRGGPLYNLENTMEAFRYSVEEVGCDIVELDCFLTKDKKVVVFHDESLTRVFSRSIKTDDALHSDFGQPMKNILIHFNKGRRINTENIKSRPCAPLLIDVLTAFPKTYFCIEFKTKTRAAVDEFLKVLRKADAMDRVITGSGKHPLMLYIRKKCPQLATWATGKEVKRMLVTFLMGLMPYSKYDNDMWMIPYLTKEFEEWETSEPYIYNGPVYVFLLKILKYFYKPILEHMRKRGLYAVPWVVNNTQDMQALHQMGAIGVMTDDPLKIDEYVTTNDLLVTDVY